MSGMAWDKFFWSDYASDPALKICSFAAQGLWMRMLCIMAEHDPVGWLAVNGQALDNKRLARMTGGSVDEIEELVSELERNGVFSRDRRGWIYSRRMINDAKKRRIASVNGKKGVEVKREKQKGNSGQLKGDGKGSLKGEGQPHIPEARVQSKKNPSDSKKTELPEGWIPEAFGEGTKCRKIVDGWTADEHELQLERFKAHHERERSKFSDWQAAWKTWVLNSESFRRNRNGGGDGGSSGGGLDPLVKQWATAGASA